MLPAENESCSLLPQHLERRHALDPEPNTHVRDLDTFSRCGRYLVRHNRVAIRRGVADEVVVGHGENVLTAAAS